MSNKKSSFHENCNNINEKVELSNFYRIFEDLKILSCNRYRWENLPLGLESRHIERALFEKGQAFFYDDPALGFICLPAANANAVNHYGESTVIKVTSWGGGFTNDVDREKGVLIKNNDLSIPTVITANYYAEKMANVDWHINRNLDLQATPYTIVGTKDAELSMKFLRNSIRRGEDAIIIADDVGQGNVAESIRSIPTLAPFLVDKLVATKKFYESEFLTRQGINNLNFEKKERLITSEADSNNDFIKLNLDNEYKTRLEACEAINKKFNINMKVIKVLEDQQEQEEEKEKTEHEE